jgi:hypothetical protein
VKRIRLALLSLTVIVALLFAFSPTQVMAADPGGPQGTTNTKPPPPPPPPPPWYLTLISIVLSYI